MHCGNILMNLLKLPPFRSKKYREWVASNPCCYTGYSYGVIPHHPISCGLGGAMGSKVSDLFCIPLNAEFHSKTHAGKDGFEHYIDQKAEALKMIELAVSEGVLKLEL